MKHLMFFKRMKLTAKLVTAMAITGLIPLAITSIANNLPVGAPVNALIVVPVALLVVVIFAVYFARTLIRPIVAAVSVAERIADDDLSGEIDTESRDEIGDLQRALATVQSSLQQRLEANAQTLAVSIRIEQALNNVNANVMVSDADLNIIYMNKAVSKLFAVAEADIRKDLPNFSATGLLGSCIDLFHKNPAHQRSLLATLDREHTVEAKLGGRTLKVVANPVFAEDGERLGTVVEWTDRTQELAVQEEVQQVVTSALAGDLSQRISLDNKEGFFEALSGGVNDLVGIADQVINDTIRVLGAMATGDLTETIDRDYQGSFDQLKRDANTTIEKLTEVVGNIQSSSGSVTISASEIADGNTNLSQRTEEQAASLEETSSAMAELTETVKKNAEYADQANEQGRAARALAEKGGVVVSQAVVAMEEINNSSKKISDIIGVIDEIAFQTKLLALNASVEAARAGNQGSAFAVVAGEVRNLAARSAEAAKDIKNLIEDSTAKVEDGSRLVSESGEMLDEIVHSVKKVTGIVGDIAVASREQSTSIDEVSKAISQMDDMTQQNAALVEQAAAASDSLRGQAKDLDVLMQFFTVDASARVVSAEQPSRKSPTDVERRSADRPWTPVPQSKIAANEPPVLASNKAANSGGNDWQEF